MAIVFTPAKKTRGKSFWIITILLFFILAGLSMAIFWLKFNSLSDLAMQGELVSQDIRINFDMMDSDRVQSLEAFVEPKAQFNYVAEDSRKRRVNGSLMADTQDEAKSILASMNLTPITIEEVASGRTEPFSSYYK